MESRRIAVIVFLVVAALLFVFYGDELLPFVSLLPALIALLFIAILGLIKSSRPSYSFALRAPPLSIR